MVHLKRVLRRCRVIKCVAGILAAYLVCVVTHYMNTLLSADPRESKSAKSAVLRTRGGRADDRTAQPNGASKEVAQDGGTNGTLATKGPSPTTVNVRLPPSLTYMAREVPHDVEPSAQRKLIVMFNRPGWLFPGDPLYLKVFDTCPYTCDMTDDRTQLPRADAVWVDVGRLNDPHPPPIRPPHQMWVAYNTESPVHYLGHVYYPAWWSVFNWTFSYRTDAEFFRPYGEFEFRSDPPWKNYTQIMFNKTKSVAWFVSNCHTRSGREKYVRELKKYIDVDIYGTCGTFDCPGLAKEKCFRILNTTYFFYLALENSYCQDYVTEKLFKTYNNLNVIPVVRGAADYSRYLPPNTYLDTANFSSPRHLAEHLHSLMKDVHGYTGMLRTKDHFHTSLTSWVWPNLKPFCELCRVLQMSSPPSKVYPNIMEWSMKDKCWGPRDL